MNIISQNCLAGNLYKVFLKKEFTNPFIWTVIDFASMIYLIENFDNINFENFELIKDNNWNFSIIIDKNVKVQYVHYKFDPNAKNLSRPNKSGDLYYCKIWEYIVEKYKERTNKMLQLKEKPIFCICNFNTIYKDAIYTDEQLSKLTKYENVLILKGLEHDEPYPAAAAFFKVYNAAISG